MDLLQRMAMDSSMPKWGCRKKGTLRLPVDNEVQQPTRGHEKEKPAPPKPCHQPPPLPEVLVDEDDPDWKEEDAKEESKGRSKRKRRTEDDKMPKKEKKEKEIPQPRPEFLFRLTQEQVADDFKLFTARVPSRRSCRPRPTFGVLRQRMFVAAKSLYC